MSVVKAPMSDSSCARSSPGSSDGASITARKASVEAKRKPSSSVEPDNTASVIWSACRAISMRARAYSICERAASSDSPVSRVTAEESKLSPPAAMENGSSAVKPRSTSIEPNTADSNARNSRGASTPNRLRLSRTTRKPCPARRDRASRSPVTSSICARTISRSVTASPEIRSKLPDISRSRLPTIGSISSSWPVISRLSDAERTASTMISDISSPTLAAA